MTINIGFACKDCIVLATDSQISWPDGSTTTDLHKLVEIRFKNGSAILAKAGTKTTFDSFEEDFSKEAATTLIDGPRVVIDLAERVIKKLRVKLLDYFAHPLFDSDDAKRHLEENGCSFIVAYSFNCVPYIYTLDLWNGNSGPQHKEFTANGCAAGLARFIVSGIDFKTTESHYATALAVYVVTMCAEHEQYCKGPAQAAMIVCSSGDCNMWPSDIIGAHEAAALGADKVMQKELAEKLFEYYLTGDTPAI